MAKNRKIIYVLCGNPYTKGLEYSYRELNQKELIAECRKLNKHKVNPDQLRNLSVKDRERIKRQEFNYENMQ